MTEFHKKAPVDSFSEDEKYQLKKRIFKSVHQYKRKRLMARVSIAASLIIGLGIGAKTVFFTTDKQVGTYTKLAKSLEVDSISEVSLVLQERTISVGEEDQVISYNKQSNKITIGNDKSVEKDMASVMNTLVVPYGRRTELQLSDGTKIWVNSGSKLIYPSEFKEDTRTVYLEGEAAFDVAHDKEHPFIVLTEGQEIEVLGTVFNVSSYADEPSVNTALQSGKVKISYHKPGLLTKTESVTLLPGNVASYSRHKKSIVTKADADIKKYFLWKDGLIVFKNDNLGYILNRLSKYYNVDIQIDDEELKSQKFSGYLDLKDSVGQVLELIKQSTDFEYDTKNGTSIYVHNNTKTEMPMK
ncbi:FecR family protein [Mangrovimonas sp. TPBH4]|uniref:FecR family protein n=1 Tax=Mangrovimonas sp. TPBH4 TaxID=1645914 RepID=UPI0006B4C12E|nr:FecR domain-containing protein [Mangrovimonas sp. TPBH4]